MWVRLPPLAPFLMEGSSPSMSTNLAGFLYDDVFSSEVAVLIRHWGLITLIMVNQHHLRRYRLSSRTSDSQSEKLG